MMPTIAELPVFRKDMVICRAIGAYKNGPDQKGKLTRARLQSIVDRFSKYPRQVPVYLGGEHFDARRANGPADGWVEALRLVGDELVATVKLVGAAAEWIANDRMRGASIGTVQALAYDGTAIGEVLDHVVISDESFIRDLNIAAARAQGGEAPVLYFSTALKSKEATVAEITTSDGSVTPGSDPRRAGITDEKALGLLAEQDQKTLALMGENLNLVEQIEKLKEQVRVAGLNPKLEEAMTMIESLKRKDHARDIIALVEDGVYVRRTLKLPWTKGYKDGGLEGTIQWLAGSRFKGNIDLLRFQVENGEVQPALGKTFSSGTPVSESTTLSQAQKESIRAQGFDPEKVQTALKAVDAKAYVQAVAQKE